jgi:hypothetical protein
MRRLLVMACLATTIAGCAGTPGVRAASEAGETTTRTVSQFFGLECRTDQFESVVNDFGAVTGLATAADALTEFFESEGRRFSALEPSAAETDDLTFAFVDADGLVQLVVRLTDERAGHLVGGYSYCVDRG